MKRYQIIGLALLIVAGSGPTTFAGRDDWRRDGRSGRDNDRFRHGRNCRDRDLSFTAEYLPNNFNYLGYPPWYRLNYYTPWLSDYRNGTAWTKIPTSHAAEGYGMPSSFNTMPSGYYAYLAATGGGAANVPPPFPGPSAFPGAYPGINPGAYPGGSGAYPGAGSDVVQPSTQLSPGMDIVVTVQRELRRRGFFQGVITGVSDKSTRAAIRAYEARAGLPATGGVIGIDLLRSLGLL